LSQLRAHLPDAPIVFAADQAGLPYGKKSEAEVAARVCGLLGRMAERYRPRLICIACNTASTIALGMVRDVLEIPIVGTVPAIKPAAAITKTGVIAMLGTEATIRQAYVDNLQAEFAADKVLLRHGAPGLVDAAETKLRGQPVAQSRIDAAVAGLLALPDADRIDAVVLACTHFPLLRQELAQSFGSDVLLIDGAEGIARRIVRLVEGQTFKRESSDLAVTTGAIEGFVALEPLLLKHGLERLERF